MRNLPIRFVACASLVFCLAQAAYGSTILNGGFETGDFSGWTTAFETGGSGNWYVQSGAIAPVNIFDVPTPPEGTWAAMTDGTGPGAQVLLQTFTVAPTSGAVTLSFDYFRNNLEPAYVTPDSLDFTGDPNQQARVDILTADAGAFDLDSAILMNVFQTNNGDVLQDSDYQTFSVDISSVVGGGGTFQLRFAEVDNLAPFNFGVDDVAIDTGSDAASTPEPGTPALLITGLVSLLWWCRYGRCRRFVGTM